MKNMKQLREEKNLTQKEVAEVVNITVTYLSLLENGKRNASDALKMKFAKLYGCKVTDIFLALKLT